MATRTDKQNRALHLYFQWVADSLNDAGLDLRAVLKPEVEIPWEARLSRGRGWRPAVLTMLGYRRVTRGKLEQAGKGSTFDYKKILATQRAKYRVAPKKPAEPTTVAQGGVVEERGDW